MERDRSHRKTNTDFRAKVNTNRQGHYTMINRSTHAKDKGIPNAFVPNSRTEKKIIVGDFTTTLTEHGRIPLKVLKNTAVSRIVLTSTEPNSIRINIP